MANHQLIGAGATLSIGGLLIPGSAANTPQLSGTLSANNVNGLVVNGVSMSTGTSTAVSLTNTNGAFTFRRIHVDGAPNAIVWNNTTAALAASSLTITGDDSTAQGGDSSGGVIANVAGANGAIAGNGIYLNNAANVTLRQITINGTNQNHAIRGYQVNNFVLEYSTISGSNGNAESLPDAEIAGEGAIYFGNASISGLSGAGTFTRNLISGGRGRNVSIINATAGTTTLTFKGNWFGPNQSFVNAGHNLAVEAAGSGTSITAVVGGVDSEANVFNGAPGDLINFTGQIGSTMNVQLQNNLLSHGHPNNTIGGGGIVLATEGTMTFVVDGNTVHDSHGSAITLHKANAGVLLSGRLTNNVIGAHGWPGSGSATANGIYLSGAGTGTIALTLANNQIHNWTGAGMLFDNTGGSYTASFTIQGNTLAQPTGGGGALAISNGGPGTGDRVNVCAVIGGATAGARNSFSGGAVVGNVVMGSSGDATGHVFNLPGYAGSTTANVESFVAANNDITGGATYVAYADAPATAAAFTGTGTSCPTP